MRAGVEYLKQEFFLEYAGYGNESGSSGVTISRYHEHFDLWYRYLFTPTSRQGHFFLGGALGLQRDHVETQFFSQNSKDVGRFEAQLSAAGGYRFSIADFFAFAVEGRLATSNNFEPKVLPSGIVSAAVIF